MAQLRARGELANQEEVLREIIERDQRDSNRAVGPMRVPEGAQTIDTTSLSESQVIDRIVDRAQARLATAKGVPA